jgi:hypothetical protein
MLTIGTSSIPIPANTLPKYKDLKTIVPDIPLKLGEVAAVHKIVTGAIIVPISDVTSHKGVLNMVKAMQAMHLPTNQILRGFGDWTAHPKWFDMTDRGYMFQLSRLMPELVNFDLIFRHAHEHIGVIITENIESYPINDDARLAAIQFFSGYKFEELKYPEMNMNVRDNIKQMNRKRIAVSDIFLIDPTEWNSDRVETTEPTWSIPEISDIPKILPGTPSCVSPAVFKERFDAFTGGIFNKNPEKFPLENVVFAGGAISKMMLENCTLDNLSISDLDLFPIGKDQLTRAKVLLDILKWFDSLQQYKWFVSNRSVISVYLLDIKRKFQIISTGFSTAHSVIARFDSTNVQWCYHLGKVYTTARGLQTARDGIARIENIKVLRVLRILKTMINGFSIEKNKELEAKVDMTKLISKDNRQEIDDMIDGLYKYYYPECLNKVDGPSPREIKHIRAMIAADARCDIVRDTVGDAMNNAVIGGNFESDYSSNAYSCVNLNSIAPDIFGKATHNFTTIKAKIGTGREVTLYIMSDPLTVVEVISNATGVTFTMQASVAFGDWCRLFDQTVGPRFGRPVTKPFVSVNNTFTFMIESQHLDVLNRCREHLRPGEDVDICKSQFGTILDVTNNVKTGDICQMQFRIQVCKNDNELYFRFHLFNMIKRCDWDEIANNTIEKPICPSSVPNSAIGQLVSSSSSAPPTVYKMLDI